MGEREEMEKKFGVSAKGCRLLPLCDGLALKYDPFSLLLTLHSLLPLYLFLFKFFACSKAISLMA